MSNYREVMNNIKAFVFDVDGVLASHNFLLNNNGESFRTMNIKDGYAIQYSVKKNFLICVISGGNPVGIKERFGYLGVKDIYVSSNNKKADFHDFLSKYNLQSSDVLYMGDDIPDMEVMKMAALPACPSDAAKEIKEISKYISPYKGGDGCVRDVIEQVLKVQGKWLRDDAYSW